ncbi:MAG: hypothetical protein LQ339_008278 [Xanthoria mediterranea]|nr:MAG: hypothetical protein LQ339_008278 [Xanthoria mediterranea]
MGGPERLFAVTISGKRKADMSEDDYHEYISKTHAGHLKHLLVQKQIVDYTMQHNTSELMKGIHNLFPHLSSANHSSYDAFITIVFRDVQDYINVKNDPHYTSVVSPDHGNFADGPSTMMSFGWFERHVAGGQLVEK